MDADFVGSVVVGWRFLRRTGGITEHTRIYGNGEKLERGPMPLIKRGERGYVGNRIYPTWEETLEWYAEDPVKALFALKCACRAETIMVIKYGTLGGEKHGN